MKIIWVVVFSVMAFTPDPLTSSPAQASATSERKIPLGFSEQDSSVSGSSVRRSPNKLGKQTRAKNILVAKFGGSSLADSERIRKAARSVADQVKKRFKVAVVVSAMGKTTDALLEILQNSSGNGVEKHDADDILSMGERTSARVFAAALKSEGLDVRYFDPGDDDWPIITDENFSDANPILAESEARIRQYILPLLDKGVVPVIAGFVGRTRNRVISTIGRGGSDTTAFILARALDADEVILATDSDGIMTADPKLVPEAKRLDRVDVNLLVEMADSGKKFIHRKALKYKDHKIDVKVINFSDGNLASDGTRIIGSIASELEVELVTPAQIQALTVIGNSLSRNPEIISELAETCERYAELLGLSANSDSIILYLTQTENSEALYQSLHKVVLGHSEAISMTVRRNMAYVRIKGVGLEETPGVIGKISEALRMSHLNISGILTITSSIMVFVDHVEKDRALLVIKRTLGVN